MVDHIPSAAGPRLPSDRLVVLEACDGGPLPCRDPYMIVPLSGRTVLSHRDSTIELAPGQAGVASGEIGEGLVELTGESLLAKSLDREGGAPSCPATFAGSSVTIASPSLRHIASVARDYLRGDVACRTAVTDRAFVTILFTEARRALERAPTIAAAPPRVVNRACQFIAAHIEAPLPLEMVAGAVRVTPYLLAAAFRQYMGQSLRDYVRETRLMTARRLVLETSHSLADIAFRTGYASQSYMTTAFKTCYGQTPGAMRKNRRFLPPAPDASYAHIV